MRQIGLVAFLSMLTLVASISKASADPQITVGTVSYGGSGCPSGSMASTFAPDNMSFSLLYDSFVASVSTSQRPRVDIRYCDVVIPLEIPQGMQLSVSGVDYRGFVGLPDHGHAGFMAIYAFDPSRGSRWRPTVLTQNYSAPISEDYTLSSDNSKTQTSGCGGQVRLRLRNILTTHAPMGSESQITLDSIDGQMASTYRMNLKKCR